MKTKNLVRLLVILLTLAMMIPFASCNLFNKGSLKLESFTVVRTSIKTEYEIGEAIDFSGIKAIAKYNDETLNKEYTFAELTITYPQDITATVGTKQVTVSFNDPHLGVKQETTVSITVVDNQSNKPAIKLESFVVDTTSIKTQYEIGEAIDFSGIKATATYNDASLNKEYTYAELTITYADDITATAGNKQVTVSFNDPHLNVEQKVDVTISVPVKLVSFTVDKTSIKTECEVGEVIDFSGIQATAVYNDASLNKVYTFAELTVDYDADITATEGYKIVTVSFDDPNLGVKQKATVTITVDVPVLSEFLGATADISAVKTRYEIGEAIDFSGIKVVTRYEDETLNKEYTFADLTITYADDITATVGNKQVAVSFYDSYYGLNREVEVTINVPLKLLSFVIDNTSIKTEYQVGDAIDLSGIKATVTYNDASFNKEYAFADLTILCANDITATEGNKQITVSFVDSHLNVEQKATVTITVSKLQLLVIESFNEPETLTHFNSANKNAGTLSFGAQGFSGQFAVGGQTYIIGNQNEFKLNYIVNTIDPETEEEQNNVTNFYADVVISLKKNGQYVELTEVEEGNNVVKFYDGDVLMATVNTYTGVYQFSADAANAEVKISVVPSEEYYIIDHDDDPPKILEAKVINAYNVYEAWQLAVVDNYNAAWTDFKTAHGIADLNVSGIVLHRDINLTANDVPESFFYTTTAPVSYYKYDEEDKLVVVQTKPAGTKYLIDGLFVYERFGAQDFVIEGNFFTLSAKEFPLVASPGVFGKDAEKDYGSDFSNAALFRFTTTDWGAITDASMIPTDVADVTVNNIALIGNAARDTLVDSTESLASAGGLIFYKTSSYTKTQMNNIIGNSYFITYFTDWGGDMIVKNAKCYDSYQNAAFVWSNSRFELIDSYVSGCGGPVIIAQSVQEDGYWPWHPVVIVTGGKLDTSLSGKEIWFTAVNANSIVESIKLLGMGLQQAGLGNFIDSSGKMNVKGAVMAKGSAADEIVTNINAQGSIMINGKGIDRFQSAENVNWTYIYGITQAAMQGGQMPPFFTVTGADGVVYSIYFNGTTFVDLAGNALGTDPSHAALAAAFMQADTIALTQGGLSVVFELYHY